MATGYIPLFPGGFATDGSGSGNDAAAASYEVSGASQTSDTPKVTQMKLLFDGNADEHWIFQFPIPGNYSSGGTLRGKVKFTSATSGTAILKAGQVSTVDSSTDDDALAFAAEDNSSSISAPGTQGQVVEFTITLTTTNMSAGRKCVVFLGRDTEHASDTITTDLELMALVLEYTTT